MKEEKKEGNVLEYIISAPALSPSIHRHIFVNTPIHSIHTCACMHMHIHTDTSPWWPENSLKPELLLILPSFSTILTQSGNIAWGWWAGILSTAPLYWSIREFLTSLVSKSFSSIYHAASSDYLSIFLYWVFFPLSIHILLSTMSPFWEIMLWRLNNTKGLYTICQSRTLDCVVTVRC